ncbi:MAG TPA: NADP oxidoreductase [Candidatus Omnitrophica bacterium]|nr:MAG: NADP oxidoreductase [Omnitrophica WOR_2 bacterium GWA2_45_18]HBR14320.1 NADP oxidoreductase [Candidatus Omnitrophota bacterium]
MSEELGTNQRPLRVAIIGSGPSGFYAADALLSSQVPVRVDMFDRLPSPYGLVRYGVAPDHQKIKNVIKVYERIAEKKGFAFWGNVNVGRDISLGELKRFFDAVILAYGAETDKKLGIPGEDLPGSHTATEFVAWYNGHPDYKDRRFDLSGEVAVVIGQGNVAVDVCRILCKTADELKTTDIAGYALDLLAASRVKEVHMIGRRGPAQAAFTPVEIDEFGDLGDCDPVVDPRDMEINEASRQELSDPANVHAIKNFEILKKLSSSASKTKRKKFYCHFLRSPVEIVGQGKVQKVILEKNRLEGEAGRQKAKGTGDKEELASDILFRSVGYRGIPMRGLPFNEEKGIVPNSQGRVMEGNQVLAGFYATGWIKRGPSGVIGTNKADSQETVKHLLEDMPQLQPCESQDMDALARLLLEKKGRVISFADWKKIDAVEMERGKCLGKPREKFVSLQEIVAVL